MSACSFLGPLRRPLAILPPSSTLRFTLSSSSIRRIPVHGDRTYPDLFHSLLSGRAVPKPVGGPTDSVFHSSRSRGDPLWKQIAAYCPAFPDLSPAGLRYGRTTQRQSLHGLAPG